MKTTLTVQLAPAASVPPFEQVPPAVTENGAPIEMLEYVMPTLPSLFNVKVWATSAHRPSFRTRESR